MREQSLWEQNIHPKIEPALTKDIATDILIIGGGITGISTAFELKDSKKKIVLVDQDRVGYGVSLRTTGKLTYLQNNIYPKIEKTYGEEKALQYLNSQIEAIKRAKKHIKDYQIDCDFEEVDSYLFITEEKNKEKFNQEYKILKKTHPPL